MLHYEELVRYFSLCISRTGVVDGINLSLVPTKVRGSAVYSQNFYSLRDRIVKLETELACLLEYHVLNMNTMFEEKTSHAAEVKQETLADYATGLAHCIILPDRASASHHA